MGVLSGRWRENVNWAGTVGRPTPLAFFFWPALIYFSLCLRARAGSPSFTFLFSPLSYYNKHKRVLMRNATKQTADAIAAYSVSNWQLYGVPGDISLSK